MRIRRLLLHSSSCFFKAKFRVHVGHPVLIVHFLQTFDADKLNFSLKSCKFATDLVLFQRWFQCYLLISTNH